MTDSKLPAVLESENLGPMMTALKPEHRKFVAALWDFNGNQTEAYIAVYGTEITRDSAKAGGCKLANREDVQRAVHEFESRYLKLGAQKAIRVLERLMDEKTGAKHETQLKSAIHWLSIAGHTAVSEARLTVTHELSEDQVEANIRRLMREIPQDEARRIVRESGVVIDAEFSEVPKQPTPEELAAQLERVRANARRRGLAAMTPEQREASKAHMNEQRREKAKARYKAAQADIAARFDRGEHFDLVDAIADAEAQYAQDAGTQTDIADTGDGSEGLEDLIGSSRSAAIGGDDA